MHVNYVVMIPFVSLLDPESFLICKGYLITIFGRDPLFCCLFIFVFIIYLIYLFFFHVFLVSC